jgi:transglutaminase-like putative cysteine protease
MNTDVYLQACPYVDWHHESVLAQAALLSQGKHDIYSVTQSCFEFVRDEIKHSWDYRTNRVTVTASEALEQGSGFCYSKSHLLAALLRANAIPTAIVYQRVQLDQTPSYCLHALNAVCLPEYGWYRLDARGNTADIDAQFTPPVEKLAIELFGLGEFFLEGLFASPLPCVTNLLESCDSVEEVVQRITETDAWDREEHE